MGDELQDRPLGEHDRLFEEVAILPAEVPDGDGDEVLVAGRRANATHICMSRPIMWHVGG